MKRLLMITLITIFSSCSSKQKAKPNTSIYDIKVTGLEGKPINLANYRGKKILFVNVASKCGFTSQYKELQKLYDIYKNNLMIIGAPCNQFGGQESGTQEEIKTFCQKNYGVTFLMTEKLEVKGSNQHPLYAWLTKKELNGNINTSVKWNFQKYLIDEDGNFVDYYYSTSSPLSKKITKHLEP